MPDEEYLRAKRDLDRLFEQPPRMPRWFEVYPIVFWWVFAIVAAVLVLMG
jgi:hypothetical protein